MLRPETMIETEMEILCNKPSLWKPMHRIKWSICKTILCLQLAPSPHPPPPPWGRKQIQFSKRCVPYFLEYRTMEEVQKKKGRIILRSLKALTQFMATHSRTEQAITMQNARRRGDLRARGCDSPWHRSIEALDVACHQARTQHVMKQRSRSLEFCVPL
jgi:hypothetical protein